MSDQTNPSTPASPQSAPPPRRRGRGWLFISTIAVAAAITGGLTTRAVTQGFGPGYWHSARGPMTPAELEDRADRAIRHAAIELEATPEQQEKVRAIAKAALKDLVPIRDKARSTRERATALLTQPTVDRAAIEAFRTEQMALAEAASKRFAQALADVSEVLTPDQRRKVADFVEWRRSYWRGWRRG